MIKGAVEHGLVASGVPRARIRRRASGTVILSYHNVVPEGEVAVGDTSLHISQRRFAEHLDRLLETHDIVALGELRVGQTPPQRPRAVITFDDAYRGALTAGFDELARRQAPATVFVSPGLLGAEGFWWDQLARGVDGLDPGLRDHALGRLGGRGEAIVAWASERGLRPAELPPHARPVGRDELFGAVQAGAYALGSHTWSHVNLAGVPLDEARREIETAVVWLADVDPDLPTMDWLAYPYGLYSDGVVALAAESVAYAVRVDGGATEVGGRWCSDRHRLPRINVPAGLSGEGLVLRLAGIR